MPDQRSVAAIERNVELILSQCRRGDGFYVYQSGPFSIPVTTSGDGLHDIKLSNEQEGVLRSLIRARREEVVSLEDLHCYKLSNEQVELLRSLFQAQDAEGRKAVVGACSKTFSDSIFGHGGEAQAFVFLARFHSFGETLGRLTTAMNFVDLAGRVLPALSQVLKFDHAFISDDDVGFLLEELPKAVALARPGPTSVKGNRMYYSVGATEKLNAVQLIEGLVSQISKQAQRIQYLRLRKALRESANFEINQDRDRLLDSLSTLGFSTNLTKFLRFAEVEFAKAQDSFNYKSCIDQIRSFFSELLTETAEKVAASRSETLAAAGVDTKQPVKVRDYLRKTAFFSEQFEMLVTGQYRFMSDMGTHTLGATKDVARIARNITIEIGLLITKRVQELPPTPAP